MANGAIQLHLECAGFEVHEVECASLKTISLGYCVDGARWTVGGERRRVEIVRAAFFQLSRRPRIKGRAIEKLLGHAIHLLLPRRDLLALPRALYDFIHMHYDRPVRLWRSAAIECSHIATLLPIAFARLDRPLCHEAFMYDACLTGVAVAASPLPGGVDMRRLINTPEGNNLIVETMRQINQYDLALSNIAQRAAAGELDRSQARQAVNSLQNPIDLVRAELQGQSRAPRPGDIVDGYRYNGGPLNDPASYTQVNQ